VASRTTVDSLRGASAERAVAVNRMSVVEGLKTLD
jgi:hypothetical protein